MITFVIYSLCFFLTWNLTTELLVREYQLEQERLVILFIVSSALLGQTGVSPVDAALGIVQDRHRGALIVALAVEGLISTTVPGEGVQQAERLRSRAYEGL